MVVIALVWIMILYKSLLSSAKTCKQQSSNDLDDPMNGKLAGLCDMGRCDHPISLMWLKEAPNYQCKTNAQPVSTCTKLQCHM